MHLNRVFLIGTLVRDPEVRYVGATQTPVSDLRVVVNRLWKTQKGEKREEAVFIDVTVWARQAETCVQYLRKGRLLAVEGRLTMDEWTSSDGKKNSRIRIGADRVVFLPNGDRSATPPDENVPAVAVADRETEEQTSLSA